VGTNWAVLPLWAQNTPELFKFFGSIKSVPSEGGSLIKNRYHSNQNPNRNFHATSQLLSCSVRNLLRRHANFTQPFSWRRLAFGKAERIPDLA